MQQRKNEEPVLYAAEQNILPAYFAGIKERLQQLHESQEPGDDNKKPVQFVGGGTDLYVQKHDEMVHASIDCLFDKKELKGIEKEGNKCVLGSSVTVTDISGSTLMQEYFPDLQRHLKLVSSTPIRNMATIAGNFVNASPIGDLTIFFLALDAQLVISDGKKSRELPLRKFYKGYKSLDKSAEEFIEKIWFELPGKQTRFNFEKVSKRTHLDIASVNTAISITMNGDEVVTASLSAGGVGPVPAFLENTSAFLKGKNISEELIQELTAQAQEEIKPISDTRGTEEYKRLLLSQLIKAHFLKLFPELSVDKMIIN